MLMPIITRKAFVTGILFCLFVILVGIIVIVIVFHPLIVQTIYLLYPRNFSTSTSTNPSTTHSDTDSTKLMTTVYSQNDRATLCALST